jgi:DNA-binding NtrC family response regulator
MITATNDARLAVECLKKGAYDYLVKPVTFDNLVLVINRALERKRLLDIIDLEKQQGILPLTNPEAFKTIVTSSAKMWKILKEAELHGRSNAPILITGESGTGKELLARAIHLASPRAGYPFTAVNMAIPTANLFEAEFFGHTKGAFTGAEQDRQGYLEYSEGGTLFLDEIGALSIELQGKLLRMLQEGEYLKLGSSKSHKADVRFIAATNDNLNQLLAQGLFRQDLFYRLRGAWIHLTPLRERKEDILLLANKFLEEFCHKGNILNIEEQAASMLLAYDYPGNIRELRAIIQSVVNLSQGRPISPHILPDYIKTINLPTQTADSTLSLLEEVEKDYILKVYNQTGKNKLQTARILGMNVTTLRRKMKSYGVD